MTIFPKISLRYKLLFLLCLLATTVLSIFLAFSISLFKKDKTVYIFDSSSTYSRSLSSQLNSSVFFTTEKINILLAGLKDGANEFNSTSINFFNEDKKIKNLIIISDRENQIQKINELRKDDFNQGMEIALIEEIVAKIKMSKIAFLSHEREDHYLLGFTFSSNQQENIYALVVFESLELKKQFNGSQSFSSYLIDQNGEIILKGDNVEEGSVERFINSQFFNKLSKNKVLEGTAEIETQDGAELLISYNRVGFGELMVITEIDKNVAFKTLQILLMKSALFFLALLSLSIIFSVIFSNSLTSSLLGLSDAVKKVADGNFDVKVFIRSRDEVGQLAEAFNSMTLKISHLLRELQDYSANLEMMVKERTRDLSHANNFIQTMINSLGQGLLVFDKEGKCLPIYTQACVDIFKITPKDKAIWDVFNIKGEKLSTLKKWVHSVFQQLIPFKDMIGLGPKNIEDRERLISLDYRPMLSDEDGIENLTGVVVVATDKTEEHLAKLESKKRQDHVEMITKIIKNKDQFLSFIKESNKLILNISQLVESGIHGDCDLKKIKLMLHSLKGSAGVYSLSNLQKIVHDYETDLENNQNKSDDEMRQYLVSFREKVENLERTFESYNDDFATFLGDAAIDGQYRVEVKHDELKTFSKQLEGLGKNHPIYLRFVEDFVKVPIINFFRGHSDLVVELAKKRMKIMAPITFQGGNLKVDKDAYGNLFMSLVHIFTNAVDHGLEAPDERIDLGKAKLGHILVSFSKEEFQKSPALKIIIQDDGRGIDPKKIREKLIKNGMSRDKIETDDFEIIQHVFDESFTTAESVSLTSGRGVGMSAVKSACEAIGGAVSVQSGLGKGTRVVIILPYF